MFRVLLFLSFAVFSQTFGQLPYKNLGKNNQPAPTTLTEWDYFGFNWTHNNESLFMNLNLINGLDFAETYQVFDLRGGKGCEMRFLANKECTKVSSEGYPLKSVLLTVYLLNGDDNKSVEYLLDREDVFEQRGFFSHNSQTIKQSFTGTLSSIILDLNELPSFFTIGRSSTEGFFQFGKIDK